MLFSVITGNLDIIRVGLWYTCVIFFLSYLVGFGVGVVSAALRMSAFSPLRWIITGYVEIMRNTPLLVQVFLIYLALPLLGVRLSGVLSVVVALALNNGAYLSEIIRGGLQSVPKGQLEAAAALGLSPQTTFVDVILPQAFRSIYPSLVNQMISTLLGSSVGSVIGAPELSQQIFFLNSRTYRTVELLLFLSGFYALATFVLSNLGQALGKRLEWTNR